MAKYKNLFRRSINEENNIQDLYIDSNLIHLNFKNDISKKVS